jgi:hypothetical protein
MCFFCIIPEGKHVFPEYPDDILILPPFFVASIHHMTTLGTSLARHIRSLSFLHSFLVLQH